MRAREDESMNALLIVRVIAAMLIDAVFFGAAVYAAHVGAFPREAAVAICTALVIARTQTARATALSQGAASTGTTLPPSSAAMALLGLVGIASKAKGL
jgi:hypothetical protein